MHDGVDNSFEEEIIAGLLDSLAYAEVITIDPDAANTGTELAAYNNVQLFALMNSVGRRGAGLCRRRHLARWRRLCRSRAGSVRCR